MKLSIRNGDATDDLLVLTEYRDHMKELKGIFNDEILQCERIIKHENAGINVIQALLENWMNAIASPGLSRSQKALKVVLGHKRKTSEIEAYLNGLTPYKRVLEVTDFLSGMTDNYLTKTSWKLTGQQFD